MNHDPFFFGRCNGDADGLVDKLIGNAYQVVKYVAINMPKLSLISDNMAKVTPVGDNIAAVIAVNGNMASILLLNESIDTVAALGAALPQLVAVNDNLPALINVNSNLPAILAAPDAAALAQKWATQTSAEVIVGLGYGAKYYADLAAATLTDRPTFTQIAVKAFAASIGYARADDSASNVQDALRALEAVKPVNNAGVPTAGTFVVGNRSVNTTPAIATPVVTWVCTVAGTPGTWRALEWLVFSGATGSRPTLGTNAVGVVYLDTTLAAAGKPITWTGTVWVDATGASV